MPVVSAGPRWSLPRKARAGWKERSGTKQSRVLGLVPGREQRQARREVADGLVVERERRGDAALELGYGPLEDPLPSRLPEWQQTQRRADLALGDRPEESRQGFSARDAP